MGEAVGGEGLAAPGRVDLVSASVEQRLSVVMTIGMIVTSLFVLIAAALQYLG